LNNSTPKGKWGRHLACHAPGRQDACPTFPIPCFDLDRSRAPCFPVNGSSPPGSAGGREYALRERSCSWEGKDTPPLAGKYTVCYAMPRNAWKPPIAPTRLLARPCSHDLPCHLGIFSAGVAGEGFGADPFPGSHRPPGPVTP